MNKKLQVFVSSTYTDLIEERQVAVQAILDAGHIPAGMELFKAGKSQMKTIKKWINESDVYMLILGGRYGSIEKESDLSYTELEYNYALSKNMPVFAIILDDSFLFTKAASHDKDTIFEKDNIDKYDNFKENIKSNIVKFASNIDQIFSAVHSQLNYFINDSEYDLLGWTRNSISTEIQELQQKNKNLIKENNSLKKIIVELKAQISTVLIENITKEDNIIIENKVSSATQGSDYTNTLDLIFMDHDIFLDIKHSLQSSYLRISSNNVTNKNSTSTIIQNCFLIFLDNYVLLQKGVLNPIFDKNTRLLYTKICPVFEHHNLVIKEFDLQYGFIYKITEIGTTFYNMAQITT